MHLPTLFSHICLVFVLATATAAADDQAGAWGQGDPLNARAAQAMPAQVGEYVTELYVDRRGTLWMGTLTEGLCRYDAQGFRCLGEAEGYASGALRAVVEDAQGVLWFGGQTGLSRWDGARFLPITGADQLASAQIWSLLIDRQSRLWVGTEKGLYRRDGEQFRRIDLPLADLPDAEPRFSTKLAFALMEDRQGQLWIGTDGVGALRFDGTAYTRYTHADGLASNDVTAIVEDRAGKIWFTSRTGGGISRFDGHRFAHFDEADGVPAVPTWAAYRDRSGTLWFGSGGSGVLRYDGERFERLRDESGLTRNHVQSIAEDADGVMWFGFSGGLFRLGLPGLPGQPGRLINVTRAGPWTQAALRGSD